MKIIFLDDMELRHRGFDYKVNGRHEVVHTKTVAETIQAVKDNPKVDILSLDHDLGFETIEESYMIAPGTKDSGSEVAEILITLNKELLPKRIIFHTHNDAGAQYMFHTLRPLGIPMEWRPYGNNIEDILSGNNTIKLPSED